MPPRMYGSIYPSHPMPPRMYGSIFTPVILCHLVCMEVYLPQSSYATRMYESIYPSHPMPPRMYESIKAHTPEKTYPIRIIVSTIGTVTYGISEYLVKVIQPTLNKSVERIKNHLSY